MSIWCHFFGHFGHPGAARGRPKTYHDVVTAVKTAVMKFPRARMFRLVAFTLSVCGTVFWILERPHNGEPQSGGLMSRQRLKFLDEYNAGMVRFDAGKQDVAAIFADAVRVEPVVVAGQGLAKNQKSLGLIDNFPIVARAPLQPYRFAGDLGDILLDGRNYAYPGRSVMPSWFEPDLGFRVVDSKGRKADVLFTIQSRNLIVVEDNPKVPARDFCSWGQMWRYRVAGDLGGSLMRLGVEAPAQPVGDPVKRIFALVRRAFPNDKELLKRVAWAESL